MCTFVCMQHLCIPEHMCVCRCACTCACMHVCLCMSVCMCVCACLCECAHTYACVHVCFACVCMHAHVCGRAAGRRAHRRNVHSPPRTLPQPGWSRNRRQPSAFLGQGLASLYCPAQRPASVTHQQPGLEDEPGSLLGTSFRHFPQPAA